MSDPRPPFALVTTTFEKQVLHTQWDPTTKEETPVAWVEHGEVVCSPRSTWEATNLFTNGFRWQDKEKTLLCMKDGPIVAGGSPTQARQIVRNTLNGGLG